MPASIQAFFDETTYTASYVVADPATKRCAIIDPVLDYDPNSGRTRTESAEAITAYVRSHNLHVEWILETHVHADHLTAAAYLHDELGGQLGIGHYISQVQQTFARLFNSEPEFPQDGSQFDRLFQDNETFNIGELEITVWHTPGHTPACLSYLIDDAVFVGDTLFMPDSGTARCDFPGGDARALYRSIQRLMSLPDSTRVFLCHDYKAEGRDEFCWETTIGAQKKNNVHIHLGVSEDDFVAMRTRRDATLRLPQLMLPSVQINMRGGQLPPPESNGVSYLKIPLNTL